MKLENPIYESDPYLADFKTDLDRRHEKMAKTISSIEGKILFNSNLPEFIKKSLDSEGIEAFTKSYSEFGLHLKPDNSVVGLEWAPQEKIQFLNCVAPPTVV